MVEAPPSIFKGYGDQQICVVDNIASRIAEALATSRPVLQLLSNGLTLLLGVALISMRRNTDNKTKQLNRPLE